jgi:uncharacterized protein (UPF0262 family)
LPCSTAVCDCWVKCTEYYDALISHCIVVIEPVDMKRFIASSIGYVIGLEASPDIIVDQGQI